MFCSTLCFFFNIVILHLSYVLKLKFYEKEKSRDIFLHILVNVDLSPSLDGPMKDRESKRNRSWGWGKTYCLYNDERTHVVNKDFEGPSRNILQQKPSYLFEGVYFYFVVNLFI